jgi:hypothetical protein
MKLPNMQFSPKPVFKNGMSRGMFEFQMEEVKAQWRIEYNDNSFFH